MWSPPHTVGLSARRGTKGPTRWEAVGVPVLVSKWLQQDDYCPAKNQNPKKCTAFYGARSCELEKYSTHSRKSYIIVPTSLKIKLKNTRTPGTSFSPRFTPDRRYTLHSHVVSTHVRYKQLFLCGSKTSIPA